MNYYPNSLSRYDQIVNNSHQKLWPKGAWTDDTDIMICIMRGFDCNGVDIQKIANNFKNWYISEPLGIGHNLANVLCLAVYTQNPHHASELIWRLSRRNSAANGALMRTAVLPLKNRGM